MRQTKLPVCGGLAAAHVTVLPQNLTTTTEGLWRAWAPRYMHSRSAPPYSTVRLGRPGIAAISRMHRSAGHARGASDSSASANAPPLRNSDVFSSISCARRARGL